MRCQLSIRLACVSLNLCQKLRRDRMACPSEDDRQTLQRTKESFENRWTNVRRTVSTKRRQAEERLILCKEFWNEYEKFVEWINETENAVMKCEEGVTSVLEISKSRLKRFEVRRKENNILLVTAHNIFLGWGVGNSWAWIFFPRLQVVQVFFYVR